MTTTSERAEINRRNALRSTGPKSPEGKERSKYNAVKHGMSAATAVLPGKDPDAFHDRLDTWAGALDPDNVVEQFLVERAAIASWKIERADHFESARAAAVVHQAGAEQHARRREEVDRLGRWLLPHGEGAFDPVLTQMVLDIVAPGMDASPWRAMIAAGIDRRLQPVVDRLESSAEGCTWLLERWAELHEPLRWGFAWNLDQYVRAVRLSGHRPLEMPPEDWKLHVERRYRGEPRGPLTGGYPEPPTELSAAEKAEVDAEECRKLGRQLVKRLPAEEAGVHAALLDLVERSIGRLTELSAAHSARSDAEAAERMERLGFDATTEGERLRRYQFGCERSLDTLIKLRRGGRGQQPSAGGEKDHGRVPPCAKDQAPRQDDSDFGCLGRASLPASRHVEDARQESDSAGFPSLDLPLENEPASEPAPASGSAGASPSRIPVPVSEARYEATAPDAAQAPVQNEAITPAPVQNEATAPIITQPRLHDEASRSMVMQPLVQNEATATADSHPGPQDEAIAPVGDPARPRPSGPVNALILLALLVFSGFAVASASSVPVVDPDWAPQGHRHRVQNSRWQGQDRWHQWIPGGCERPASGAPS